MGISLIAGIVSGFAAAIGTTALFSWAAFAISAGFSMVARALTPKPDLGAQMGGQSITTREAAHTRKIVYGRARIGGNIAYLESTGSDNKYLWLVITVAGHEIDAFESVWFNDQKVLDGTNYTTAWATANNSSTSPYVDIGFFKGDQTAADNSRTNNLVGASNKWTNDHKLLDTAYMVVRLTHDRDKFSSGLPNISTIIRGKKVLDPADIDAGDFVVGKRYQITSVGNTNFTAIGASANTVGVIFTASGVGSGTGKANIIDWSQNPALCIYDYLRDAKYGLGETTANILTASVNAAKIICDQAIPLTAGGNQPRYTMDGVIDTGSSLKSNIELMVGSMAGRLIYSGGQFEIHAGSYVAPAFTVDESQIIGEITVQTKQSRRSAFNGVKGVFLSEDDNYILADYPAQISSSFAVQDGDPIYLDLALPFTVNNVRAQRLAKLALLRSRQQEAITIPCNLSALRFKIGDNINVTNARLGYNAKVFEVVGYSMGFSSDGQMGVDVQAIETASSIWAWQSSDQDVFLGGGEVELYDGVVAKPPTELAVTAITFLAADGTNNSSFQTTWTASVDAFVEHYVVEWRLASPANQPYFSQETKLSPFRINNLESSKAYNVRVKAVNELGVSSTYATVDRTSTIDTTPPAAPSSVAAAGEFEQITVTWVNPTVVDFERVNVYRSTSSDGTYAEIGRSSGTTFTDTDLAVGVQRFYKLKAVDYTGNASTSFSAIVDATTTQVPVGGIADDAVDTAQIADLAVETNQLDNDAVTIAKIATSLQSTNYSSGSAGWKILKSGVVEFEQATIRGEVIAATGTIGGYTINSNSLFAGSGNTRVSLSTADGISLGSNTFNDAPFSVTRAGALKATSAIITGALTLTNVDGATVVYTSGNLQVGTVQTANIANDAINNAKIAVNAIQGDVIAAGAIVSAKLGADAVTSAKIADNAVVTAAINDNAITNALIATDAVNSDSLVANAVTAVKIVSGAITTAKIEAGAVVANSIAANAIIADKIAADAITANKIAANAITADAIAANAVTANAIAANSIVASKIAADAITANKINVTNLAAINANMGNITAGSISSALITGDVTEVYPVAQYYFTNLTSGAATMGSFTLPAPTSGILKRAKLDLNALFDIQNNNQTPLSQAALIFVIQKKSKGVNAVSVGQVTVESFSLQYNQLLSISGNVLDKLDVSGGVAPSADASGTNEPASIQAVFFDGAANKTFIQTSSLSAIFSTNDTLHFSDSKFTSSGTFVTPGGFEFVFVATPPDPGGGVGRSSVYLPFKMSYGQSTTATDFRVRAHVSNAQSNVTYKIQRLTGTMENIS